MRLRFRVWDREKKEMKYDGFVIRSGNDIVSHWDEKQGKTIWDFNNFKVGNMGAEPLEHPKDIETNDKISDLMDDYANYWSLIDWSNFYGLECYEVMQSTGMFDSEGNEIFEGDILSDGEIEGIVEWFHCNFVWNGCQLTWFPDTYEGDKFGQLSNELKIVGCKYNNGQLSLFES